MEIKRVTGEFQNRNSKALWTIESIPNILYAIERLFAECDEELIKAEMQTLGYENQPIDRMTAHLGTLARYVSSANRQCCDELDHPLFVGFKNGATEMLSNIVLEDITTDNTFEMQSYVEVYDQSGHYYRSETKPELTMKDFLGLDAVVPKEGAFVVENVETVGWFKALFRSEYENMGLSDADINMLMDFCLHAGEFEHKEYHPIGNVVSEITDATVIIPFLSSIRGRDMITQEKLTGLERGMKLVDAIVSGVTFGQGALVLDFSKMTGKEAVKKLLKMYAVDVVSDMSATSVINVCDELGMPAGLSLLAGLMTGCKVSVKAGKYVFEDAADHIVKEVDADGLRVLLKEVDIDESLLGSMSEEELKSYMKFLKNGSTEGMTQAELRAIQKVDERLLLDQIDYDEVLAIRKGATSGGRAVRGTLTGNVAGLTAAEKKMIDDLLNAGNNVEIIPRSNISGQKTPDLLVNGIKTEIKTLTGTSLNTPVTRIQDGFKQGAETVIIDGRNTGITVDDANTVIDRVLGKYGGKLPGTIEIWTIEGVIRRE